MKKTENPFYDDSALTELDGDLLDKENFIQALLLEGTFADEVSLSPEENLQTLPAEVSERTLLKRDLRKMALARMEAAARTEEDFQEVVRAWDREDANRERRERYHEVGRDDRVVPLEYNMSKEEIIIPAPIQSVYWKQIMKGDFLDVIFDCPYELHELVTDCDISLILKGLSEKHKALFFFLVIRGYDTSHLAKLYGQTDRNIRKVRATIKKKIHGKLIPILEERLKQNVGMTLQEREFIESQKNHCRNTCTML